MVSLSRKKITVLFYPQKVLFYPICRIKMNTSFFKFWAKLFIIFFPFICIMIVLLGPFMLICILGVINLWVLLKNKIFKIRSFLPHRTIAFEFILNYFLFHFYYSSFIQVCYLAIFISFHWISWLVAGIGCRLING